MCRVGALRLLFWLSAVLLVTLGLHGCVFRAPNNGGCRVSDVHHSAGVAKAGGVPLVVPKKIDSAAIDKLAKQYNYLWAGAVAASSFMDIKIADKAAGLISTGWYESRLHQGERFMINVLVIREASKPSPMSYRVKVRKQVLANGQWVDEPSDPRLGYEIAKKMYNRSKKLKAAVSG